MNPRLVAVSGPLRGKVRPLEDGCLSIGRDPSSQLCISDLSVSRKHSRIHPGENSEHEIEDLDSHNGTFVNGLPVSRKTLQHGDKLRIGSCEFLFLIGADDSTDTSHFQLSSQPSGSEVKTILLDPESGLPQDAVRIGHMARDLTGLFKIANVINSIRDLDLLQHTLLELISEVIPAEAGAIAMVPDLDGEPSSVCTWDRKLGRDHDMQMRSDLLRQSVWERAAVFTDPAAPGGDGEHVLCVPLVAMEKILGAIYLKSSKAGRPFGEDHAYFLSSVSRIAAVALENIITLDSLREENRRLKAEAGPDKTLIGESKAIRQVLEFVSRVANSDATVLIRGESGTGKELVARAIHASSSRAEQPFVAINCAAIPEALLESELLGHEKGAFTGAIATKKGKLEAAEDGTLFLDEIGEMAPLLQSKLLRVLQQREFERVGSNRLLPFRARVVAATNKNLETAIKQGEFRQDLYFRLNVVSTVIPPLREHREDIPLLALYFATKYVRKAKRPFTGISSEARALLTSYSWPGNIRELENAIEHAIVLGLTEEILPEDLPSVLLEEQAAGLSDARYHSVLNQTKKQLILSALEESQGSFVEAARLLGIHPKYLHRLVRNLNLKSEIASSK